jgi:hypothetical protein
VSYVRIDSHIVLVLDYIAHLAASSRVPLTHLHYAIRIRPAALCKLDDTLSLEHPASTAAFGLALATALAMLASASAAGRGSRLFLSRIPLHLLD